jgi:2-haloacid dehalogenase
LWLNAEPSFHARRGLPAPDAANNHLFKQLHMATPSPSTVVFDLGGVLIDWNPRYLYRKLLNSEAEVEDFLSEIGFASWNEQMDEGLSMAQGVAEKIAEFPQHEVLIRAYSERWPEMLGGALEGTVRILEELKRQETPLYVLSNWSAETFRFARERFAFLEHFDGLLVSGEEKLKKPDPAIFHRLYEKFSLRPEDCVFIDDRDDNIESARSTGMTGIVFTDSPDLRRQLVEMGLLSAQA